MKKLTYLRVVITVLVTIISIQSCKSPSAGKVLKFNLEKGKAYDYDLIWDMDQQMMGQDSKINISGGYTIDVTDDKNNVKTLKAVYKDFKMYMKMMGMELDIDTDKPVEPLSGEDIKANPLGMMSRIFTGIKGKEFIMKVDEEGKVLEVSGFEQIVNGMVDSLETGEDIKMQIRASLKDQFNAQNIKDQFAQVFTIFPNKEVKVGDTWEKSWQLGGRMPAKYVTKYTVKEIEGDHVSLAAQTSIGSDNDDMKIKGTQTGNLLVDSKTGLVINAEFAQDMQTTTRGMDIKTIGKGKIKGKVR
ncbi:MAG TPA: DUF6263 family protein [Chitinophagaceae bacterium]|nr:DUF6263 family protein [Chitinophagaceae bacterium]